MARLAVGTSKLYFLVFLLFLVEVAGAGRFLDAVAFLALVAAALGFFVVVLEAAAFSAAVRGTFPSVLTDL
mgnify:CR=1 FL=1